MSPAPRYHDRDYHHHMVHDRDFCVVIIPPSSRSSSSHHHHHHRIIIIIISAAASCLCLISQFPRVKGCGITLQLGSMPQHTPLFGPRKRRFGFDFEVSHDKGRRTTLQLGSMPQHAHVRNQIESAIFSAYLYHKTGCLDLLPQCQ
eukprot:3863333-Rhodomonas_salina.3